MSGMIDIGANLTNKRFDKDRDAVVDRALAAGVTTLILTGTSVPVSFDAAATARAINGRAPGTCFSTAGIHPHDAVHCDDTALATLSQLIDDNRQTIVAVGETGLDFNRDFSPREDQVRAFEKQVELAIAKDLPLFLHERDAFHRQREILASFGEQLPPAVIHCFTGSRECLAAYLEMGLYVGITGWVCDERRGLDLQAMVADIPLDRLLIETDAPYLTPRTLSPKPKGGRNEPAFLGAVADTLAHCYQCPIDDIQRHSSTNARRLFRLP